MNDNPLSYLDGANKLEDVIKYSDNKRKVTIGLCNFDVFLEEYSIDDFVEIISITESKFSDLTFLGELPNLRELYIDYPYENFMSLADLKDCVKLEKIIAVNCGIKKIEGLEKLENLTTLILFINEIPRIKGLETLTELKKLDLSSNMIEKIEGLDNMVSLESLNLSSNKIRKIEGLENLSNLKTLDLSQNLIQEIEGLEDLTKLEDLTISINNLFQGDKHVSKQELEKYLNIFPNLKSFNANKLPLPDRIHLRHNIKE